MNTKLAWGILGTGRIAKAFAKGVANSATGRLAAVGSRTPEAAAQFGDEFKIESRHGSYEALLADPAVQAVYISTPHPWHAEWAIRAAEAGKHILCEKPLTLNHAEAMAVVEAAARNDVFLMEAFMYRCHPQTAKLVELLRAKVIGEVRLIHAVFSFHAGWNLESRLLKNALGGGGILDVGCYCTSMSRLVAGAALGRDFADPVSVQGTGRLGPESRVDEYAAATLKFPGDIVAQVSCGVQLGQDSVVRIYGSEGSILVPSPWFCSGDGGESVIKVHKRGEPAPQDVIVRADRGLYAFEADTVAAHIAARQAPALRWDDTLGNMRTLDQWRHGVGVVYDAEKPEGLALPVDKRPLRVRADAAMPCGPIEGVSLPVSRLVMGTMAPNSLPYACVMYDDFFSRGGNAFDSAYVYGAADQLLGQWVKNRGIRDQVVIVAKGGHTPYCTPEGLDRQLREILERMQTGYVDLYLMHRDNPDVPVGEFVHALNEHRQAGRVRAFGVSNWTFERIAKANAYARRKGLAGIAAISNNVSLARMVEPVWAGSISSSDAASRRWLARAGIPVLSWSSQARGFFVRARTDDRSDAGLARSWYSEENFRRLDRAKELAKEKGVEPIHIALAWVLNQPFPCHALIGPHSLAETRSSFRALGVSLTKGEMRWLDLETDRR